MDILSQHADAASVPALVRALAQALAALHTEPRAHGGLHGSILKNCISAGGGFDVEAFVATAADPGDASDELLLADQRAFVDCCVRWVEGVSAAPAGAFRADFHRGGGWPQAFLELLEKAQDEVMLRQLSLRDWCEALGVDSATIIEKPKAAAQAESDAESAACVNSVETASPTATPSEATEPRVPATSFGHGASVPLGELPGVRLSLRNGTAGRFYRIEPGIIASRIAEACGDAPATARVLDMEWPSALGLVFDPESGAVEGIPLVPFEGEVGVTYVSEPDAVPRRLKAGLLINPDPASLWKELDPPAGAPYARPSTDAAEFFHGPYRIIAASRRGRSHANRGEFRDDAFAVGYASSTGWLVVVVADGAGSAKYSRCGAQLACEAVKARLTAALNQSDPVLVDGLGKLHDETEQTEARAALRQTLYEAALRAHYALQEEVQQPAESLPEPPTLRNFDTTLLVLVMKPLSEGHVAATFAIGDGGAGVLTAPTEGHPLTRPEGGEHAGQTTFLTMPSTLRNEESNLERRFHLEWLPSVTAALVMTDGITDPKFPSDAAFADPAAWAELWQDLQPALASPELLLNWMNFFSPGNHDDRTLVAVLSGGVTPDPDLS
jgi:hypothetical protein